MGSLKDKKTDKIERREFLRSIGRTTLFVLTGGFFLERTILNLGKGQVWQIDPSKCVQCGNCATSCVLNISAVKCVHRFDRCGYCKLCFGYFQPGAKELNEATENQVCPTNAIKRKFVEEPYYEYIIDKDACIGCGKCVKGCNLFGNGSFYLQIDHSICKNCNECLIATNCAGNAFMRVPSEMPLLIKKK